MIIYGKSTAVADLHGFPQVAIIAVVTVSQVAVASERNRTLPSARLYVDGNADLPRPRTTAPGDLSSGRYVVGAVSGALGTASGGV